MSFLNLYTFDGKLTRDKNQEAMFHSLNERERFLQKLDQDRSARAEDNKKKVAACKIQNFFRGYIVRKRAAQSLREEFDFLKDSIDPCVLIKQAQRLNLFYCFTTKGDNERLKTICGRLHSAAEEGFKTDDLPAPTRLALCRKILKYFSLEETQKFSSLPIGILRFIDWFCVDPDFSYLSDHGWFAGIAKLIKASTPSNGYDQLVQDSLPGRMDAICHEYVTPGLEKGVCEKSIKNMMLATFCNEDDSLMFSVLLPYIARTVKIEDLERLLRLTSSLELSTEIQELLRCHFHVLLLSPEKNLPFKSSLQVFRGLAAALPIRILNDKISSKNGYIEAFIYKYLHSQYYADLFSATVKNATSEDDMRAITKISSIAPKYLINVMSSTSLFMDRLFSFVTRMKPAKQISVFSKSSEQTYAQQLTAGTALSASERCEFLPSLSLLSTLVCSFADSTLDEDFAPGGKAVDSLHTIVSSTRLIRDLVLGLIDLAFPDNYWSFNVAKEDEKAWSKIYEHLIKTLATVHRKNNRVTFLPDGFWIDHGRTVMITRGSTVPRSRGGRKRAAYTPFSFIRYLAEEERRRAEPENTDSDSDMDTDDQMEKPSTNDLRNLSIVRSVPFLLRFDRRLRIFQDLMDHERGQHGRITDFIDRGHQISISVTRQNLYEDSYNALTLAAAPDLKGPIRVRMINWAGIGEPGIDGGGIFREFLSELLKTGLDPERGLFCYTHDRLLYPNPTSSTIYEGNYFHHFYFLGRMIAKLIFEGMMLDVRFADFFLMQLLGYRVNNIDLEQMKSYDPNVYKHLRDLLNHSEEELSALNLDFSVVIDTVGKIETIELKPAGSEIAVNKTNLREYIQLYVNYYLMKRISPMVDAMRAGVSNVIEPVWLGMFDPAEIQVIVSGMDADINVEDMKIHTTVYPVLGVDTTSYMAMFWGVVYDMNNEDKSALLKFITGCPRPPIAGFRSLAPTIAVQLIANQDLLPTSATCMNMLKLPVYKTEKILRTKILYAIHSGAGFELA